MITYLDLDGVLVDFNKAACEILGVEYPPKKWHWHDGVPNGWNKLNAACDSLFWESLDWAPNGHDILRTLTTYVKPENIYLLTTPMPNLDSASGKARWVHKHLPAYDERLIITRAPKHLFAGPDRLLIDDRVENIHKFAHYGGEAILIPREWNRNFFGGDYPENIVIWLEENLKAFFGEKKIGT